MMKTLFALVVGCLSIVTVEAITGNNLTNLNLIGFISGDGTPSQIGPVIQPGVSGISFYGTNNASEGNFTNLLDLTTNGLNLNQGTFIGDGSGLTNLANAGVLTVNGSATNLAIAGMVGAHTLYVDPVNGNDSTGDGSWTKPFRTIGYQFTDPEGTDLFSQGGALGVAKAGDTIRLAPGDFTNEVVQLWVTNTTGLGISLIGSGRTVTRLWAEGTLPGSSTGEGIIQLGNGSVVSDLAVPRNPHIINWWQNPIATASDTTFWGLYGIDYYY